MMTFLPGFNMLFDTVQPLTAVSISVTVFVSPVMSTDTGRPRWPTWMSISTLTSGLTGSETFSPVIFNGHAFHSSVDSVSVKSDYKIHVTITFYDSCQIKYF